MKNIMLKIAAAMAYAAMIFVNYLANILPIGGRSTGAVSDAYPNLFAPAGYAFSIWGLIYLLLGGYVVFQFTKRGQNKQDLIKKINPLFIATSLLNIAWIFVWHYDYIGLSALIIAALLVCLIRIADIIRGRQWAAKEKWLVWAPFSVYFGWITVAAIANITVFLVSAGWDGFGIADCVWTIIILIVGAVIGILRMRQDKNLAYGAVLIWAYAAILFKHLSVQGFGGQYPGVIAAAAACLILFALAGIKIYSKK